MGSGQAHNQIDKTDQRHTPRRLTTRGVAAAGRMNGPDASSLSPFVRLPSQATKAAGRMASQVRPAAPPKLHVDDFLGHDATCMGAGGQLVGLPLIFMGLDHVAQDSSPIAVHCRRPLVQAPRPDAGNMRAAAQQLTENPIRGFSS